MRNFSEKSKFSRIHLEMIKAVVSFALSAGNVVITNSIAAFATLINALKSNLTAIANLQDIADSPVTGYAEQKRQLRKLLAEFSAPLLRSVAAYAVQTGNDVLLGKVKASRGALLKMSNTQLTAYIAAAINSITPIVGSLSTYNITDETMELWQENLDALIGVLENPKNQHANQNAAKKGIQNLLRTCMEMLYNQCDTIVQQFIAGNRSYYDQYKYNRKLIPLTRHTKLKLKVTDELNQPIPEVNVVQNGTENKSQTGINGETELQLIIEPGHTPLYEFTISKGEQRKRTGLIQIKKGETVSITVVMAPTGFVLPAPPVVENVNA